MTFSVEFLGCKISHTDVQGVRERLLAGGLEEASEGGAVHVVNTCCVTNEAVAKSRKAVRAALRRGAAAGLRHGLRHSARPGDVRGRGRAGHGRARQRRGGRRAHRPRARRDRLRRARAAAGAHAGVPQGAGRLHVRLLLLRDPARARREPLAAVARRARRGATAHRPGPPRARRHGRQSRPLPRCRGSGPAARGTGGAGGARRRGAHPPLVDRGQPPQRAALRGARAPARVPAPARPAAVRRRRGAAGHAPALRPRDLPAPRGARPRARARPQPHGRRHRGLPGRGRRGLRAHARSGRGARVLAPARVPVLAAAGNAHGRRRSGARRRQAPSRRAAARALRSARARRIAQPAWGSATAC